MEDTVYKSEKKTKKFNTKRKKKKKRNCLSETLFLLVDINEVNASENDPLYAEHD